MAVSVETDLVTRVRDHGFALVENLLSPEGVDAILRALGDTTFSQRNLLANPDIANITEQGAIPDCVERVLGPAAFPVRAILFDKIEGANWKVPWHQDLIIPVGEKQETPGFRGWSVKDGVPHVHPPADVLAGMLTVRLHLDD